MRVNDIHNTTFDISKVHLQLLILVRALKHEVPRVA